MPGAFSVADWRVESDRTGSSQIWKMPAEGGQAIQITKLGGFGGFESPDGKYFYYSKSERGSGVWRIPIAGGPEEPVLPDVPQQGYARCWAIVDEGLYFVNHQNMRRPSVEFFTFATRLRTHIATLPNPMAATGSNLTISPDRSHLLVVLVDQISADVMLVENFQ